MSLRSFSWTEQDDLDFELNRTVGDADLSGLAIRCDEVCTHDVHFMDKKGTIRAITGDRTTIISIGPERMSNEVPETDVLNGFNVKIGKGKMIFINGGFPLRLCGWFGKRNYLTCVVGSIKGARRPIYVSYPAAEVQGSRWADGVLIQIDETGDLFVETSDVISGTEGALDLLEDEGDQEVVPTSF